jgi:hypothetical protein
LFIAIFVIRTRPEFVRPMSGSRAEEVAETAEAAEVAKAHESVTFEHEPRHQAALNLLNEVQDRETADSTVVQSNPISDLGDGRSNRAADGTQARLRDPRTSSSSPRDSRNSMLSDTDRQQSAEVLDTD